MSKRPRVLSICLPLVLVLALYGCASFSNDSRVDAWAAQNHNHAVMSSSTRSAPVKLMDGMGRVEFPITTNSEEAQLFFNQGVAQLYGFWFPEAERSFMRAAELDPAAAMPYWGIAMAAPATFIPAYQLTLIPNRELPAVAPAGSPESRARSAIVKAQSLSNSVTLRERLYIDAVAVRHNPRLSDPDRAYLAALRGLTESFPDDLDAKCMLALALENGYEPSSRLPKSGTDESLRLLKQVLAKNPRHVGASHFLVHALEGSKSLRDALPVAERYAALAPNIPHALHMPGHVLVQIGMYDAAVKAFLKSAAKEREYMSADPQYSKLHYLHNELLLLHALGSQGRYEDAMKRIGNLMSVQQNPADPESAAFYHVGWFSLMKVLVRFEKWNEILDGKTLAEPKQPFERFWYHWAQGLAYASRSDAENARHSLQQLDRVIDANSISQDLRVARLELEAYVAAKTGDLKNGIDGLERAAAAEMTLPYTDPTVYPRPVLELLGRTALDAGDFETAESAYRQALANEPGSGRALWGLTRALDGLDKKPEAESMRREFYLVWRGEELK